MSSCELISCDNDQLENEPYCILHADLEHKDPQFYSALKDHVEKKSVYEDEVSRFNRIVFPVDHPFNSGVWFTETFGNQLSFHYCTFMGRVDFKSCDFKGRSHFANCEFRRGADFSFATFGGYTSFAGAKFKALAGFAHADFRDIATFRGAHFDYKAEFASVTFSEGANFQNVKCDADAELEFTGIQVATSLDFDQSELGRITLDRATIEGNLFVRPKRIAGKLSGSPLSISGNCYVLNADFKGDVDVSFAVEGEARISNSCFGGKVDLSNSQFRSSLSFQNFEFQKSVQLNNSEFKGTVRLQDVALTGNNFSLRQCVFGGRAILSNSRKKENLFHEARVDLQGIQIDADHHVAIIDADLRKTKLVDADVRNIDFIGVRWPRMSRGALAANCDSVYDEICEEDEENPKWSKIEQLYRELKQSYEKAGDYYSAGHFHIGEKDTHLKTTERPLRRMMLQVYRSVSIYGERVVPAIFWLIGVVLTFGVLYLAAGLAPVNGDPYLFTGASPGRETWISLSNAVTYSLQVTAFSAPEGYEVIGADGRVLRVIQRSITTPLIALAALAIRQQMKR